MPAMRTPIGFLLLTATLTAQQPPAPYVPSAEEKRQIEVKCSERGGLLQKLGGNPLYADVAVYRKAAEFILRHPEEFANAGYVKDTLAALDKGIARAKKLAAAAPSWKTSKGRLVRAYISTVDGSVQPYGLIIPESYTGQPARLDIWMHGTNSERSSLHQAARDCRACAAGTAVHPDGCLRPQQRFVPLGRGDGRVRSPAVGGGAI
jgi:hypothetical protein